MKKENYMEILSKRFENDYDLEKNAIYAGESFDIKAEYHLRNERYAFTKKAVLYAYELEEFHFIRYLDMEPEVKDFYNLMEKVVEGHKEIVNFHDEHMATIIYLVFISDKLPENKDLIKALSNYKKSVSSFLNLEGWVDFGVLYYSLAEKKLIANKIGMKTANLYLA